MRRKEQQGPRRMCESCKVASLELRDISERRKDATELKHGSEIDLSGNTVFKAKMKAMAAEMSDLNDVFQHSVHSSGAMRPKGSCLRARSQFARSSRRWRAAHSVTSPEARGER